MSNWQRNPVKALGSEFALQLHRALRLPNMVFQQLLLEIVLRFSNGDWKFQCQQGTMETDHRQDGGSLGSCQEGGCTQPTVSITIHSFLPFLTWSVRLPIALLQLSVVMGNAILQTIVILAFLLAVS